MFLLLQSKIMKNEEMQFDLLLLVRPSAIDLKELNAIDLKLLNLLVTLKLRFLKNKTFIFLHQLIQAIYNEQQTQTTGKYNAFPSVYFNLFYQSYVIINFKIHVGS